MACQTVPCPTTLSDLVRHLSLLMYMLSKDVSIPWTLICIVQLNLQMCFKYIVGLFTFYLHFLTYTCHEYFCAVFVFNKGVNERLLKIFTFFIYRTSVS